MNTNKRKEKRMNSPGLLHVTLAAIFTVAITAHGGKLKHKFKTSADSEDFSEPDTVSEYCRNNTKQELKPPLYCVQALIHGIWPMKVEVMHEKPYVFVFRQAYPPGEVQRMLTNMAPIMRYETTGDMRNWTASQEVPHDQMCNIRTGRTECLMPKWLNRASAISGLLTTGEHADDAVSIMYKEGGNFGLHHDTMLFMQHDMRMRRSATYMIYLSDPAGGGTVFPEIGVKTQPAPGDALIWYSHLVNGERDLKTIHGGCTVTEGEKWIINVWIRYYAQRGSAAECPAGDRDPYVKPGWFKGTR